MGLRYDARIICVLLLPLLIIGSFRRCNPFNSTVSRKIIIWFLGIYIFLFSLLYSSDFGHFSYLSQRLNAQVLNYAEDASISGKMLWQTYPVIKILLGMIIFTALLLWLIKRLYKRMAGPARSIRKWNRLAWSIFFGLVFAVAIFGRIGQYPLRWSDAFSLRNDFEANTALNPIQSFFSTLNFRNSTFNLQKTKEYYSLMADHLGVQQQDSIAVNYERVYKGTDSLSVAKPNVVLVICESFSAYKSSMWGNPLKTTPFFDQLCRKGLFFDHCFTPSFGTARGVWATITGTPDVEIPETASRNPAMVDQSTIINDFNGYQKMYFIGGSTSWANIRGLLMNNIEGLHLYEGQDFGAKKEDVWGISDKNLFLGANEILGKQTSPFFAVIQTADNHRPYTIPDEDLGTFKKESFSVDTLKKYGFESDKELNAFRYADYCFQQFFEAAAKEKYFSNTIFVFVGDHGVAGNAEAVYPAAWTDQRLTDEHVPLLFYAPALLPSQKRSEVVSQIDILPTIAGMLHQPYVNTTLGRDLLDPAKKNNYAFITNTAGGIGMVTDDFYFSRNINFPDEELTSLHYGTSSYTKQQQDSIKQKLSAFTNSFFETAKYMLMNNKKD